MKTKNIYQKNNRENKQEVVNVQRMTSLEIAEVAGKQHCDVMRAIRKMEPAWTKVNGSNFALVEYRDCKGELRPCYELTKTECLYIATKFNDEARARWCCAGRNWRRHGRESTGANLRRLSTKTRRCDGGNYLHSSHRQGAFSSIRPDRL